MAKSLWMGTNPVFMGASQVAEILHMSDTYYVRNLRENGTIGICFSCAHASEIRPWLDANYPGWSKVKS